MHRFVVISLSFLCFLSTVSAQNCEINPPKTTRSLNLSATQVLPSNYSSATVSINNKTHNISNRQSSTNLRLRKGVNKITTRVSGGCQASAYVVAAPRLFFRPYPSQTSTEELRFTKLIENPVGLADGMTPAATLSDSLREPGTTLDSSIALGQAFFAQLVDHDLTSNSQFQNGPSTDANNPLNLSTPDLDLDNLYGFGRISEDGIYRQGQLRFKLMSKGHDVPRTDEGIPLIGDKRDDITGLTLQAHVLFKRYHNFLITRYLRKNKGKELSDRQKRWLFEMVRNEVIGTYQSIIVNELSDALLGEELELDAPAIDNIPVEFSAAAFRIGHSLVPDLVQVDDAGNKVSAIDRSMRGPGRIIVPWRLLLGDNAQKAARFDNKIAPVMQELIIPLSPTNPALADFVGGSAKNIGGGRVVDGVLRLDLAETNILRAREQGLPSGEEVLALVEGRSYDHSQGSTDLWVYILNEANTNFKYGKVGGYIFQRSIAGLLQGDKYSIVTRKYSKKDKKRFAKETLETVAMTAYPEQY